MTPYQKPWGEDVFLNSEHLNLRPLVLCKYYILGHTLTGLGAKTHYNRIHFSAVKYINIHSET